MGHRAPILAKMTAAVAVDAGALNGAGAKHLLLAILAVKKLKSR